MHTDHKSRNKSKRNIQQGFHWFPIHHFITGDRIEDIHKNWWETTSALRNIMGIYNGCFQHKNQEEGLAKELNSVEAKVYILKAEMRQ